MRLLRTEKQKDNFAKYLYDISKIIAVVAVIGPFVNPEKVNKITFVFGVLFTIIFFIFASIIDSKQTKLKQ